MKKYRVTKELGEFKERFGAALISDSDIKNIVIGDTSGMKLNEVVKKFKSRVKDHLFIEETVTEAGNYIFYDVTCDTIGDNIKNCEMIVYVISHRDIISGYNNDNYPGNLTDVLSQMIENALLNEDIVNEFGIGELNLTDINIYNGKRFYGRILTFSVPAFRNRY